MHTKNYKAPKLTASERLDAATLDANLRLGIAIRNARENLDVSQTELANWLGVAQSSVSRIEAGRTNVSVRTLVHIASVLRLGLCLVLGDEKATLTKGHLSADSST